MFVLIDPIRLYRIYQNRSKVTMKSRIFRKITHTGHIT
jgi:hypothetical protein